ncbi:hypothetical protein FOQG_19293, partial [Fusarium oxysporum f. sp. raphani 54005]
MACPARSHFITQSVGSSASSRDRRFVGLQAFMTRDFRQQNILPAKSERDFRVMLKRTSFPERPDACMEVAEVESDQGGGGLTIGGIIGAVLVWRLYIKPKRSQTSTSIHVDDVDPGQSSDKDAASRGIALPSTHTVRSIAAITLTQAFNIIRIAYIPGVIKRANPKSLFSSAADER